MAMLTRRRIAAAAVDGADAAAVAGAAAAAFGDGAGT